MMETTITIYWNTRRTARERKDQLDTLKAFLAFFRDNNALSFDVKHRRT